MLQRVPRQWPGKMLMHRSTAVQTDLQNGRPTTASVVHSLEQACQFLAWDRRVSLGGFACRGNEASGPLGQAYTPIKTYHFRLHVEPFSQWAMCRISLRGCAVNAAGQVIDMAVTSSYPGAAVVTALTNTGASEAEEFSVAFDSPPFQIGAIPSVSANPYTVDVDLVVSSISPSGSAYIEGVQFWALPLVEVYNQEGGCVDAGP